MQALSSTTVGPKPVLDIVVSFHAPIAVRLESLTYRPLIASLLALGHNETR
ncbi:MAG: hypothetical protein HY290_33310 [Planctomycetia bacterium]|nr:hypothetical protein [Planctomycetia bacterium]